MSDGVLPKKLCISNVFDVYQAFFINNNNIISLTSKCSLSLQTSLVLSLFLYTQYQHKKTVMFF